MENTNTFPTVQLQVGAQDLRVIDLQGLFGARLRALPVVLRLLLENVLRHMQGRERDAAVAALLAWLDSGSSEAEIAFQPGRVLMHDTTSTPALVDIAAMRNALDEAGVDPMLLNPGLPVDVSVDHSLAVEVYAQADAATLNLQHEIRRNAERYRFLRWASQSLDRVRVHPPGTGIMHTINLEQLATVVTTEQRDGVLWAVPDMMIGTDSHTPMVNGIGVLGWGVGGLEAQTVMFGMPTMLRIPDVVGVRLSGALPAGVLATDLALTATQRLRALGVSGEFVEYFGPGVATLSAGERAVVANMAPEYGATTGFFAVDAHTLDYLRATGRSEAHIALVEAYCRHAAVSAAARRPAAGPPGGAGGHYQLHQYLGPLAADRRRFGGAQGAGAGPGRAGLGQDLAGAGLAGRGQLPAARRPAGRPGCGRLRHRRLRLHHLHRQSWALDCADPHSPGGRPEQGRRHPVGQPQFPRPGAPGHLSLIHI